MAISFATIAARRFGYGLKPGETPPADVAGLMLQLERGSAARPRFPHEGNTGRREAVGRLVSVRLVEARAAQDGRPNPSLRKETQDEAERLLRRDALARVAQAVASENGFFERLAGFWVNHFSINATKTYELRLLTSLFEAEAIRPHLRGRFVDLLRAAVLHPAMLIYLDQSSSVGPESPAAERSGGTLNRSLAQELLETYTLGPHGGFTPEDVTGAALILTGLAVDARTLEVSNRPGRAEPGAQKLLGKSYSDTARNGSDHMQMLADLAQHPATAQHVCGKLASSFIADEVPADLVESMVAAWQASDGNLSAVYKAMLEHPLAFAPEARKVVTPFGFVVSALRAFDVKGGQFEALVKADDDQGGDAVAPPDGKVVVPRRQPSAARLLTLQSLRRMGQPVWEPPSPNGFPDDAGSWLSAHQLTERISWARMAVRMLAQDVSPLDFLQSALGDGVSDHTRACVADAPNKVHAYTIALASPQFNRS
ncbi:DUF1800 family protein [Rhizobium helianthi]|uniref:DUF1800 family protein n=1 Tax=Rhizobium helianthi TaxID=1132695 RepID=A0ABW4LYC2_9HYPH